jgi:hypothetical protein
MLKKFFFRSLIFIGIIISYSAIAQENTNSTLSNKHLNLRFLTDRNLMQRNSTNDIWSQLSVSIKFDTIINDKDYYFSKISNLLNYRLKLKNPVKPHILFYYNLTKNNYV